MEKEQLRITLDEAVYELERIIDDLGSVLQEDLVSPLEDIREVLSDMLLYHIYTFGCTDPRVNSLNTAKRSDLPDYQEWLDSMADFVDDTYISIGGNHNDIE